MDGLRGYLQKMIDKKTFKKAFGLPFEKAGFVKKGQSWYLHGEDAIIVVNLQKSSWSELFYINMGIWLKAFGETVLPQFNHCHLYYRVEYFFQEQRELIITACSLESSNLQILSDLAEFIENQLIPFLHKCTYESYLRELMSKGKLDGGLVRIEARMYLLE
jgi:hypothetical protein